MGYGIFRIQPSEIAKLALLVYTADIVSRRGKELYDWRHPARHTASWRDLAWDGVGGVAATVVAHQADR